MLGLHDGHAQPEGAQTYTLLYRRTPPLITLSLCNCWLMERFWKGNARVCVCAGACKSGLERAGACGSVRERAGACERPERDFVVSGILVPRTSLYLVFPGNSYFLVSHTSWYHRSQICDTYHAKCNVSIRRFPLPVRPHRSQICDTDLSLIRAHSLCAGARERIQEPPGASGSVRERAVARGSVQERAGACGTVQERAGVYGSVRERTGACGSVWKRAGRMEACWSVRERAGTYEQHERIETATFGTVVDTGT